MWAIKKDFGPSLFNGHGTVLLRLAVPHLGLALKRPWRDIGEPIKLYGRKPICIRLNIRELVWP